MGIKKGRRDTQGTPAMCTFPSELGTRRQVDTCCARGPVSLAVSRTRRQPCREKAKAAPSQTADTRLMRLNEPGPCWLLESDLFLINMVPQWRQRFLHVLECKQCFNL